MSNLPRPPIKKIECRICGFEEISEHSEDELCLDCQMQQQEEDSSAWLLKDYQSYHEAQRS